jgi:hypothetical protein
MKKVSIIALHLGYGGIEKSISTLANLLVANSDIEVEIASVYELYDKPVFPLDDRIKVKYLLEKGVKSNEKEWREALHGLRPIKFIKESFKSLKILHLRRKEVINYIKETDSDVIISTRTLFNELVGLYAKENVLKIGWEHNHHHNDMKYATEVVTSAKNLDYFILVSKDLQKFYRRKLLEYKVKCVYIPNTLENIPKTKSPLTAKRIVSVGRLSKEKGYLSLLEIYKEVRKKYPDWVLDIIGDGKEKETLEKYIKENDLTSSVTLHGFQDSDYINNIMHKASIYVMTSYTESFGIVLLEAMSNGLPCLAFDSAEGAKEIITSGRDGYLIRHRNNKMMVSKINDLIKDPEKRKELGSAGRSKVKEYSKDKVIEQWLKIINK